jgi:hypothetical protein
MTTLTGARTTWTIFRGALPMAGRRLPTRN